MTILSTCCVARSLAMEIPLVQAEMAATLDWYITPLLNSQEESWKPK